jgi:hypothetical protein
MQKLGDVVEDCRSRNGGERSMTRSALASIMMKALSAKACSRPAIPSDIHPILREIITTC